ncbi:MAG: aspartate aminotransferase family protein [Rhodomicrobiaceae bacterium]
MPQAQLLPNDLDLTAYWMPYTANRQYKADPRLIVSAEGMWLTAADGRKILDAASSLWCVNAGHCRREIVEAIQRQAATLDYAAPFQMGHPLAFQLATRIAGMTPAGMDRVFFTNSGSESVDSALKIALAYHHARGEAGRVRFIGRDRGYHGAGLGGTSVGGMIANRRAFGVLMPSVDHLPHTHDLGRNAFSKGQPEHGAEFADALEDMVALHGAETIAGVIVEPVAGSTGVLVPPKGYLERLRAICDEHGLLLIFDEVITGFGRLGTSFAAEKFGVTPDIMTLAKGLTSASVPMGAVVVKQDIHDALMKGPEHVIEFFHGYTYSGHPLASAAAMATLDIYENEGLFERAARLAPLFEEAVHSLKDLPNVVDIRNIGLMAGIELSARNGEPGKRGYDVFLDCFRNGVQLRVTGDIVAMSPPLIIEEDQIAMVVEKLGEAIRRAA